MWLPAVRLFLTKRKPEPHGSGFRELHNLSSYNKIISGSQVEVNITEGGLPVLSPPDQSPYQTGKLWTRRDSNPHLITGQVIVLPLHHGPCSQFRDPWR